jgi:hypothetical protein
MLPRKLGRDDWKPKETILNINKIRHATAESSQSKEIRIVIGSKDQYVVEWPGGSQQYRKPYVKIAFDQHNMTRLKAYRQMDIEVGSYWMSQEAQMTSTMVECLQGIQTAKEAAAPDKSGSGNLMIRHKHFTRADDINTGYTIYSNTLWRWYY